MKMKRYHVFAWFKYYPAGGWSDHRSSDDFAETAIAGARTITEAAPRYGYAEVVDLQTDQVIWRVNDGTVTDHRRKSNGQG